MRTPVLLAWLSLGACATKPPLLGDSEQGKKFAPLAFLVGDWDGQGAGEPGKSIGSFTVAPDLGTYVLTRRGFNLAGTSVHEDLTVMYLQGSEIRADYYDNEGHVIRYMVYPQPQAKQVVFESNPQADGTQFRLTYQQIDDDDVQVKFDIGKAGSDYQPYTSGTVKRRKK